MNIRQTIKNDEKPKRQKTRKSWKQCILKTIKWNKNSCAIELCDFKRRILRPFYYVIHYENETWKIFMSLNDVPSSHFEVRPNLIKMKV